MTVKDDQVIRLADVRAFSNPSLRAVPARPVVKVAPDYVPTAPLCGFSSIEKRLAKIAKTGMDNPVRLSPIDIQQVCWALFLHYEQIAVDQPRHWLKRHGSPPTWSGIRKMSDHLFACRRRPSVDVGCLAARCSLSHVKANPTASRRSYGMVNLSRPMVTTALDRLIAALLAAARCAALDLRAREEYVAEYEVFLALLTKHGKHAAATPEIPMNGHRRNADVRHIPISI